MGMSDWMRIGAFLLDSSVFLTEKLSPPPKIPNEDTVEKMLQSSGCCVLDNVKSGIWIAGTSNKSFKKQGSDAQNLSPQLTFVLFLGSCFQICSLFDAPSANSIHVMVSRKKKTLMPIKVQCINPLVGLFGS